MYFFLSSLVSLSSILLIFVLIFIIYLHIFRLDLFCLQFFLVFHACLKEYVQTLCNIWLLAMVLSMHHYIKQGICVTHIFYDS